MLRAIHAFRGQQLQQGSIVSIPSPEATAYIKSSDFEMTA